MINPAYLRVDWCFVFYWCCFLEHVPQQIKYTPPISLYCIDGHDVDTCYSMLWNVHIQLKRKYEMSSHCVRI